MPRLSLLYHRVNTLQPDPWTLCVSPEHFAEHLQVIRTMTPRPDITFDDGYRDNLDNALPLLEKYDVSAQIFLLSGFTDQPHEMWWDTLSRMFLRNQPAFDWEDTTLTDAQEKYRRWFLRLRPLHWKEQQQLLQELEPIAGDEEGFKNRRLMTATEIGQMSKSALITIGAHTRTHPVLSGLTVGHQQSEIAISKRELEELIGRSVDGFAYPNGTDADYTAATSTLVRGAGFRYAYSAFEHKRDDLYQLPRVMIRDWDGDTFSRVLHNALI